MSSDALNGNADTVGRGRRVVAALWGAVVTPYLLLALWVPIARAAGFYGTVPIPAVVALGMIVGAGLGGAAPRFAARLPASLDDWLDPQNRLLAALWCLGGLLALVLFGRCAVFLGDFHYAGASLVPDEPFLVRHSCLTAYMHGAILSTDPAANVYDIAIVNTSGRLDAPLPATAARFAPFTLDAFGYPPPFLLLPRAVLLLTGDFVVHRVLFGSASLALIFYACAVAAKTLGGLAERRMWLLSPLLLANPLVIVTLQVGNFHLATVAMCVLCWVALEKRRDHLAGALVAVTTLAKIHPGLLGVMLLAQRRWRAVGAAVAVALCLVALSMVVLGTPVWRDFLFYHLPKVQSGEALRFLAENRREIDGNLAPFGIPFKLAALGFANWGWAQARTFGNVYTLFLLGLAVLAGRNKGDPQHRLAVWIAVSMLASLRSPYAAMFVLSTAQLVFLVLAAEVRSRRTLAAFVVTWALFSLPLPLTNPDVTMAVSLARGVALLGFLSWVALRRAPQAPA